MSHELVEGRVPRLEQGQGLPPRELVRSIARPGRGFHDPQTLIVAFKDYGGGKLVFFQNE